MKILIITQRIDKNDSLLGFFCGWLKKLAKRIENIYVLTSEKRNADLAKNIKLYSLGKEHGSNGLKRFFKFHYIVARTLLNKKIDIIFLHMCPEYALLAFPYAKILRIPILMWYAHGCTNIKLKIAHLLVDKFVTPSKESLRIKSNKVIITGHGIDIEKFKVQSSRFKVNKTKRIILSVGRISPIKDYETLIGSANILINQQQIEDLEFQIVGGIPLNSQKRYLDFLKNMIREYKLEDCIQFIGPIPYTQIHNYYQNCDLFVSTSNTDSLDKTVLEAMVSAKPILTCNEAFRDVLGLYASSLMFSKKDAISLAERIQYLLDMDRDSKDILIQRLREKVLENHNLDRLVEKLVSIFSNLKPR